MSCRLKLPDDVMFVIGKCLPNCSGVGMLFYMTFLFVVAVILLNLLIAQFTTSYEDVTEKAKVSVTLNRAKILANMETFIWKFLVLL